MPIFKEGTQCFFTFIYEIKCSDACLKQCPLFYLAPLLCHDTMFFYATRVCIWVGVSVCVHTEVSINTVHIKSSL